MKLWFKKLCISTELDAGQGLGCSPGRSGASSEQLRRFGAEMKAVDDALRRSVPRAEAPLGLHHSIMRAVRQGERPATTPRGLAFLRWSVAPVVVALALAVVWPALRGSAPAPAQSAPSLAAAATALEMSSQLAQTVPSAVVAPLSDELERLNQDLTNTAQFILASLP